ncbi:hypothetical protein D7X87_06385 [bacterium D16-54]|nr:hypothetical protein D7X87_06385 [bacterium D16-54]RKJ15699.1 hypothetical protein D7X65_06380 [bacterium D16-56]
MDERIWKAADDAERDRDEFYYYQKREQELAYNDEEAKRRFQQYGRVDPLLNIESALLNSADVFDYVCKTGMLYPFYVKDLKGASYEVRIGGRVIWWDDEKKKQAKELEKEGDSFELKPNSIAFVTLEPYFRIPDYLALRFNLKILHIYKGLLLGTGPLVDPGFQGRLSIPLHNLTTNTYVFKYNDPLIQVEFTKLSKNLEWNVKERDKKGINIPVYKRNPIKPGRTVDYYVARSLEGSDNTYVRSSIPEQLEKAKKAIEEIRADNHVFKEESKTSIDSMGQEVSNSQKHTALVNMVALVTTVVSAVGMAVTVIGAFHDITITNTQRMDELRIEYESKYQALEDDYKDQVGMLQEDIRRLEDELSNLSEQKGSGEDTANTGNEQ